MLLWLPSIPPLAICPHGVITVFQDVPLTPPPPLRLYSLRCSKGMLPFEERHRKANRNRKIYIAVAALAVAAGLIYAVSSSSMDQSATAAANLADTGRGGGGGGGRGWEASVGGALRAPLRAAKRAAAAAADYWRRWRSGRAAGMVRDVGGVGEVLVGGYVGAVGSL